MKDVTMPTDTKATLPAGQIKPQSVELAAEESHRFTLIITKEDHFWSERSGLRNPILCALQRHTKTLWRLYEDGLALEAMPPYRACQLPDDAVHKWQQWQVTGELDSPGWEVELVSSQASDGYSLIQHRYTNLHTRLLKCKDEPAAVGEIATSSIRNLS